ncbi:hypothetical protein D3C71_1612700 [compost metagenome]
MGYEQAGLQISGQAPQLNQVTAPVDGREQVQLFALALPRVLHLGRGTVVVQGVPGAGLQLLRPGHHGIVHGGAIVCHYVDRRGINAQHHLDVVGTERHIAQGGIVDEVFQVGQALGHGINIRLRDGSRFRQERVGQRVGQRLDLRILIGAVYTQQ